MKNDEIEVPPEARELARHGNLIAAIKLTRERSGCGLKEAKDAVESLVHDGLGVSRADSVNEARDTRDIPLQAVLSLERGQLIDAIKQTRKTLGIELKAARECVEAYLERNPETKARFKAEFSTKMKRAIRKFSMILLVLALAIIACFSLQTNT